MLTPPFIPPQRFDDAAAALAQVRSIYDQSVSWMREVFHRFVSGENLDGHVRGTYPFVRIHTGTAAMVNPI